MFSCHIYYITLADDEVRAKSNETHDRRWNVWMAINGMQGAYECQKEGTFAN